MPFKPGRQDPDDIDLDKLRTILNQTHLSKDNNPLYQFCNSLLLNFGKTRDSLTQRIADLEQKVKDCCDKKQDISNATFVTWEDES